MSKIRKYQTLMPSEFDNMQHEEARWWWTAGEIHNVPPSSWQDFCPPEMGLPAGEAISAILYVTNAGDMGTVLKSLAESNARSALCKAGAPGWHWGSLVGATPDLSPERGLWYLENKLGYQLGLKGRGNHAQVPNALRQIVLLRSGELWACQRPIASGKPANGCGGCPQTDACFDYMVMLTSPDAGAKPQPAYVECNVTQEMENDYARYTRQWQQQQQQQMQISHIPVKAEAAPAVAATAEKPLDPTSIGAGCPKCGEPMRTLLFDAYCPKCD